MDVWKFWNEDEHRTFVQPSVGFATMAIRIFALLLFVLVSVTNADQFIFPADVNSVSDTPYQIFYVGEPQEFKWETSAASVVLELWQDETDASDTLSRECTVLVVMGKDEMLIWHREQKIVLVAHSFGMASSHKI